MKRVAPHLDAEAEAAELAQLEETDTRGVYEVEGASVLLHSLPRDAWAIATSGNAVTVRALSLAAFFVALVACSPADGGTTVVVTDSAGVTIVESVTPAWNEFSRWSLSTTPSLVIGVAQGEPEFELYGVFSARRTSNGLIVVANAGTSELRFFDISGRYLYSVGREGVGPGEFEALGRVFEFSAGSLMVADRRLARLTAFDSRGSFARTWNIADGMRLVQPVGNFADGSFLLSAAVAQPDLNREGVVRDMASYYRHGPDGTVLDTLGTFPYTERYFSSSADGVITMVARPFGRHASAAVGDTEFYAGTGERFEIGVYSWHGELVRILRFNRPSVPVTAAHMEAYLVTLPERLRRYSEGIPYPSTLPAYSSKRSSKSPSTSITTATTSLSSATKTIPKSRP